MLLALPAPEVQRQSDRRGQRCSTPKPHRDGVQGPDRRLRYVRTAEAWPKSCGKSRTGAEMFHHLIGIELRPPALRLLARHPLHAGGKLDPLLRHAQDSAHGPCRHRTGMLG